MKSFSKRCKCCSKKRETAADDRQTMIRTVHIRDGCHAHACIRIKSRGWKIGRLDSGLGPEILLPCCHFEVYAWNLGLCQNLEWRLSVFQTSCYVARTSWCTSLVLFETICGPCSVLSICRLVATNTYFCSHYSRKGKCNYWNIGCIDSARFACCASTGKAVCSWFSKLSGKLHAG